jgi:hypothetical protein
MLCRVLSPWGARVAQAAVQAVGSGAQEEAAFAPIDGNGWFEFLTAKGQPYTVGPGITGFDAR